MSFIIKLKLFKPTGKILSTTTVIVLMVQSSQHQLKEFTLFLCPLNKHYIEPTLAQLIEHTIYSIILKFQMPNDPAQMVQHKAWMANLNCYLLPLNLKKMTKLPSNSEAIYRILMIRKQLILKEDLLPLLTNKLSWIFSVRHFIEQQVINQVLNICSFLFF